jgi:GNAT superfamily N-acetyltransferase
MITAIMGSMTVTVRLTTAAHPWFTEAAGLLDAYRQHYGANPAPEAAAAWMRDQVISDRGRIYLAGDGDHPYGICSVAIVPAALTLRTVWLVRDLFVDPDARGRGAAAALIAQVADDARAAGAHRLSLLTDAANTRANQLYAKSGFAPLTDVVPMDRIL